MVLLVAPLVFRAPSGPAAREIATRELRSEWSISKPARALRSLRRPPHQWARFADRFDALFWHRGQALPPTTGTAASPRRPRGGIQSGRAWVRVLSGPDALTGAAPVPSGPFGAHHAGAARLLVSGSARQDRRFGRWSWSGPERNVAPADCSSAWHASAVKETSPLLG